MTLTSTTVSSLESQPRPLAFLVVENLKLEAFRADTLLDQYPESMSQDFYRRRWACEFHMTLDWAPVGLFEYWLSFKVSYVLSDCCGWWTSLLGGVHARCFPLQVLHRMWGRWAGEIRQVLELSVRVQCTIVCVLSVVFTLCWDHTQLLLYLCLQVLNIYFQMVKLKNKIWVWNMWT